ncbi:MAG: prolipoprotein diacylglyceryl transferase [Burkholderiales bacterium]|jgi:phosphatidylglycerol:prolipoprotein diacylglycerol transferase|nr:prolipoprotein diacylglyceryl transferase [Burkholderiales bacterium]
MLMYPHIDPVALSFGPIKLHWYGVMYLLGFLFFLYGGKWRIGKFGHPVLTQKMIDDFLFYGALGVILGGRLGYCLFYRPDYYLSHPLEIIKTWDGGMSFHGGMLGVFVAVYLFARKINSNFFVISDFIAPFIPVCLMFGRLGNFINGELWGRFSSPDLPWGMVFPASGSMLPRHPSQLYEAFAEGVVLFLILLIFTSKPRKLGQTSGVFMIGYGLARFVLEFFREPDAFATGIVASTGLSLGQFYSFPMIIAGVIIFWWGSRSKTSITH